MIRFFLEILICGAFLTMIAFAFVGRPVAFLAMLIATVCLTLIHGFIPNRPKIQGRR